MSNLTRTAATIVDTDGDALRIERWTSADKFSIYTNGLCRISGASREQIAELFAVADLAPQPLTAAEHLAAAWEAAHVPTDGRIPARALFAERHRSTGRVTVERYGGVLPAQGANTERRLIEAPRPDGADKIDAAIAAVVTPLNAEDRAKIADELARAGFRKPAPEMPF